MATQLVLPKDDLFVPDRFEELVSQGVSSGERMHKARHTPGQRVLDKTGNLKAVQKLLGHASIQTTADIYTDWDIEQLAETMRDVLAQDEL